MINPSAFAQFSSVQLKLLSVVLDDNVECPVSNLPTHIPATVLPSQINAGCVLHESTVVPDDTDAVLDSNSIFIDCGSVVVVASTVHI